MVLSHAWCFITMLISSIVTLWLVYQGAAIWITILAVILTISEISFFIGRLFASRDNK